MTDNFKYSLEVVINLGNTAAVRSSIITIIRLMLDIADAKAISTRFSITIEHSPAIT
jgi:hypothetical protein